MAGSVAVYYRSFIFSERIDRIIKHTIHQFCIRTCAYRPALYCAIKTVNYWRQIDLACRKLELGNISQPLGRPARKFLPRRFSSASLLTSTCPDTAIIIAYYFGKVSKPCTVRKSDGLTTNHRCDRDRDV